jgi:hypothetical protein
MRSILFVVLLFCASACSLRAQSAPASPSRRDLLAAAKRATVGGVAISVAANIEVRPYYLPDDPDPPPESRKFRVLWAEITLHSAPGATIPPELGADSVWLMIANHVVRRDTLYGKPSPPEIEGGFDIRFLVQRTDSTVGYQLWWKGPIRLLQDSSGVVVVRLTWRRQPLCLLRSTSTNIRHFTCVPGPMLTLQCS